MQRQFGPRALSTQFDHGPKVEKTYGEGRPRDHDTLIFADNQYPVWPLTAEQTKYATIDGARMKRQVIDLALISRTPGRLALTPCVSLFDSSM